MFARPTAQLLVLLASLLTPTLALFWMSDKVGKFCDTEEDPTMKCMAGGVYNMGNRMFSGTYMCREKRSWLFFKRNETVCVPTLMTTGIVAEGGDVCGCCGGVCPEKCTCPCNTDENFHVLVYKDELIGKSTHCVSQGKASRWVGNGEVSGYSCVPDDECPTLEPTASPTLEPQRP